MSSMSSNPSNPSNPSSPSIASLTSGASETASPSSPSNPSIASLRSSTSSVSNPSIASLSGVVPTRTFHRRELVQLLSGSLGTEKAQALIMEAAVSLQLSTIELNLEQAQKLLNHLATQSGIVGITAGLAKVRLGRLAKMAA